jgi:outer membrane protein OmpA-like peptidoglycan-associated protein
MKAVLRACALLLLALSLVPASAADDSAAARSKAKKNSAASATAKETAKPARAEASTSAPSSPIPRGSSTLFPARPEPRSAAAPQGPRGAGASGAGFKEAPVLRPVPALGGALGVFSVESAYMLPERAWAASAYVHRFARMPGNATIVGVGWNFSYGFTDWASGFIQWEPYRHIHLGVPSQLSLRTPTTYSAYPVPPAPPTIYRGLVAPPAGIGSAPGYIEEFPFANRNEGGVGDVGLGLKFRLLSEWRGDPFSLAFTNTFYIPTRHGLSKLLDNQVQLGEFSNKFGLAASKTWGEDKITSSINFGYRVTRDPRQNRVRMFESADQMTIATGTVIFPERRVQLMAEHVATIFVGTSTQNTTFGARDPFDGVYGFRVYPWSNVAIDFGYRRTWNLSEHGDKHGFVFKVGTVHWPEKPKPPENRAPSASCTADRASVIEGSGETVGIRAMANDPDGDTLSYSWTATGGSVDGTGPQVRWNPGSARVGGYTITANVTDGKGGTASCSVDVRVEPQPNRAPSLTCSASRSSVLVGESVQIDGRGSDPDGESLSYSWRTNGGRIVGEGARVTLDTSGVRPGRYTVTGRVEDPRGGAADCTVNVDVQPVPEKPQASKIGECFFRNGSARVDNVCKRILDDMAVRLQNEPRGRIVLIGYSDPKEPSPNRLNQRRGDEAKKYLTGKGIDAGRIDVRSAGGQAGAGKQNRRVDVVYVPEGATY